MDLEFIDHNNGQTSRHPISGVFKLVQKFQL